MKRCIWSRWPSPAQKMPDARLIYNLHYSAKFPIPVVNRVMIKTSKVHNFIAADRAQKF